MLVVSAQDLVSPCKGDDDCCDGILCGINEGDCDSHENCAGHLRCGVDNCIGSGFDSTDDCCWEDPAFPAPGPEKDAEKCKTRRRFKQNIVHAASTLGCDFAKDLKGEISLDECSQISCSADSLRKSFTCNDKNMEETCKELSALYSDVTEKIEIECETMLRGNCRDDCDRQNCFMQCNFCSDCCPDCP